MAKEPNANSEPSNLGPDSSSIINSDGATSDEWQALGNGEPIDPRTASGSGSAGSGDGGNGGQRKRGRKPGSTNAKKQKTSYDLGLVAGSVLFIHQILATIAKTPEIELSEDEAQKLTKAALDVAAHYQVIPDDKVMAWIALATAVGGIYGTRIFAYKIRKSGEKKVAEENTASNVVGLGGTFNGQFKAP